MVRVGWFLAAAVVAAVAVPLRAHDTGQPHGHGEALAAKPLPFQVEHKGPVSKVAPAPAGEPRSGQGYWTFVPARDVLSVPEAARPHLKGAHGTLVVDPDRDIVYWGLENVGWIGFSNRLTQSWIVRGDTVFSRGNLHGADLFRRAGRLPLVAVADNVEGEVYLSDTSFTRAEVLAWPQPGPYQSKGEFHPTDVAFTGGSGLYVTDGYGKAYFMPAQTAPLRYRGRFFGGKGASQTPHGITYDRASRSLLVSARPEGEIRRWSVAGQRWLEIQGLPAGSTVCDVDLWGDYALAPCLNGPEGAPGPIYVVNLKQRAIVSTLRPKVDLGFSEAQHIHDATWYVVGKGRKREVYVLFTNWNPGGVGALKLVAADSGASR